MDHIVVRNNARMAPKKGPKSWLGHRLNAPRCRLGYMTPEHIAPDRFADRTAAGGFLAVDLQRYAQDPNALVLGLLRGGVPVAAEIAARLGLALDALAVRRLVMPERTDIAFAALAAYGEHTSLKYIEGVWDSAQLRFEKQLLDQVEADARKELEELRPDLVGRERATGRRSHGDPG